MAFSSSYRSAPSRQCCIGYVASLRQARHPFELQDEAQDNQGPISVHLAMAPDANPDLSALPDARSDDRLAPQDIDYSACEEW
jgi:hypothetical protein